MAKKVANNHYLAAPAQNGNSYLGGYWTDGEGSQRTDRTADLSEYYVHNERAQVIPKPVERRHRKADKLHHQSSPNLRSSSALSGSRYPRSASAVGLHHGRRSRSQGGESHRHNDESGSDIYVTSAAYRAPSQLSRGSRHSRHTRSHYAAPSEMSTRSKVSRKGGVVVETMSAPNPFCPNTRGCCCLLLLINLGLILITLGFVIVMQFYEPVFVWVLGIVFLIFGFIALNVALIYCVSVCKDAKTPKQVAEQDHYWTRHWQKNFGFPEIHYSGEKSAALSDRYSDVNSVKTKSRY